MSADRFPVPAESDNAEALLQTVAGCISRLLHAESVIGALPDTLREIAKRARIDRIVILELPQPAGDREELLPLFTWRSDDAPKREVSDVVLSDDAGRAAFHEWIKPLRQGRTLVGMPRLMDATLRNLFEKLGVVSSLQVPIMINGAYWGHIVFDDCQSEHEWNATQVNVLKVFAELLGVAVTRERSNEAVRQRDALLSAVTASAVAIMTEPYLHEAISKSLETVARAVRADRMFVLEVVPTAGGTPQMLMRNSWHTPKVTMRYDVLLRALSGPTAPELFQWAAPLRQGQAVKGRISTVPSSVRDVFEKLGTQSTLIVPIVIDGKYWGHISFDDCNKERDWSNTEIGILKTLAELIGTAITRERYVEELAKANTIVQNSPTILYRLRGEPSFPMIYISQNIALLGHSTDELLNSPTLYHSYVHPEDRAKVQSTMVELLRRNAMPVTVEYRMLTGSGSSRWMENRFTPVRDSNGRLVEVEGIMIDITERKQAEERISVLARTDALTGLANRPTFNDRLRQTFAAVKRGANPFAVLYLDLDGFKEVNDTRGHPVGDKLLQGVAERLKHTTRESDLVARLGGDEFAILQTEVADASACGALANKVIEVISAPYDIDGQQTRVGTSVGIAVYSTDAASPDVLLVQADQALYRAKEEGRGQFRFHSEELDEAARDRASLANDLRGAIEHNQLELYYQPQVELSTGRIVGMEALIRWQHPLRGLLLPDAFLPIAERTGMIQTLGRWVLNGACKQLAEWRQAGADVPLIAVNIALSQIKAGRELLRDIKECLARWQLKPSDLELDVTEFVLARTTLSQSDVLEELRRLGVCIAIDDFGAQYSSLDYLRTYHIGRLKIARPMVASASDEDGKSMIRAIMGLANELGVEVVAEGVETEEQRAVLVNMSSKTKGQGYYFSHPMKAEDTTEILKLAMAAPTLD